jgi:hypothetical protein
MNLDTWDETNGYEATGIYSENAVATVSTDVLSQDGACMGWIERQKRTSRQHERVLKSNRLASIQKAASRKASPTPHEESVREAVRLSRTPGRADE